MTIPTLNELYTAILDDLNTKLSVTIPLFGKNFLRVSALVQAARLKLYYYFISKIQKNTFPDLADPESAGGTLERFGRVKLGRDPYPATAGEYTIDVTGTFGSQIPVNTTFKSNDLSSSPGKLYIVDTLFTFPGNGTYQISVRALEVGIDARLAEDDGMNLTSPLVGVEGAAVVDSEDTVPVAAETTEEYREKVLESFQLEPQGGSRADYRLWAADAEGLREIYVYVVSGEVGELDIFVEALPDDSTDDKGTPPPAMLIDVEDVINQDPVTFQDRRPATAFDLHIQAIILNDIDIEITGLAIDTPAIRDTIDEAVIAFLYTVRPFLDGAENPNNKNDWLYISNLISAINAAIGQSNNFTGIDLKVNTVSVTSYQFLGGNIAALDTITYV